MNVIGWHFLPHFFGNEGGKVRRSFPFPVSARAVDAFACDALA
eukprot:CAMPEP_0119164124 /NCGR_PEP_ID=MMETSP1315-20130426/4056_1 /TAXON_ID=676789 /ORGANISM="Prasinoderma singularis, Strain RCC927" /LENGTH=42 /DNA_ID= /DNA_START= /DNA_END= /DNA_ORIENTATION=